jgi:transcriptional regulator with XRE-family HTH domain
VSPDHGALGELLRAARRAAGRTQAEAARELGVAQTSVSAMERGRFVPDVATWDRLVTWYAADDEVADRGRELIRAARGLRGAAATGTAATGGGEWPPDPATCSRRAWCGAVRRHHGLTRAELAARLGVGSKAIATLESPDGGFPAALRPPSVLGVLAELGGTTERALRAAWQPDEVAGIERLVGGTGREVVARAADVGEVLRWLVLTGVTQTEVADACGVSRPAVHQWLSGATTPAVGRLGALADRLGVTPEELARLDATPPGSARRPG